MWIRLKLGKFFQIIVYFTWAWKPKLLIFSITACWFVLSLSNSTFASLLSNETYRINEINWELSASMDPATLTVTVLTPSILPTFRSIFFTQDWHVIPSTLNEAFVPELILSSKRSEKISCENESFDAVEKHANNVMTNLTSSQKKDCDKVLIKTFTCLFLTKNNLLDSLGFDSFYLGGERTIHVPIELFSLLSKWHLFCTETFSGGSLSCIITLLMASLWNEYIFQNLISILEKISCSKNWKKVTKKLRSKRNNVPMKVLLKR